MKNTKSSAKEENPLKQITSYKIFYKHADNTGMIHFVMTDGSAEHLSFHSQSEAALLIDILRNEKPVFYDASSDIIVTGYEPVGEGEAS